MPGAPTVQWPSDALIGASRGRREPVFPGIGWPLPARAEGRWVGSRGVEGATGFWVPTGATMRKARFHTAGRC